MDENNVGRGIRAVLGRRLAERVHYRRTRDWLLSLYNRALLRVNLLPFRGQTCTIAPAATAQHLSLRLGTSDWYVFEEIFARRDYWPVLECVRTASTILDLGANIGMSVRFWEEHFPTARIVAVEPDAENAALCERNARSGNVLVVRACVAGVSRRVYLDRAGAAWSYKMTDNPQGESVPAVTVPELLIQAGIQGEIDLLKCDIEGGEAEVFAACQPWIGRVRALVVELHGAYGEQRLLHDLGPMFEVFHRADTGSPEVLFLLRRAQG